LSHLSEGEIERFLTSRAAPWERQRVVHHLLAGCGVCSRKLVERAPDRLLDEAEERRRGRASRDPLRDRTIAAALEQDSRWRLDQRKLDRSLELLGTHPEGYDGLTFRQIEALHGRPLVEALLQKSWDVRFDDPRAMRWLAYNALKAAESLRPEEHAPAALADLQARAWTRLANAYRITEEFLEAEAAFARARELLRRGSGDLHYLAETAACEASLRSHQRRVTEARELLSRVYRLYLKLGDRHLAGQALLSTGLLSEYTGASRQGVFLFRQGLGLLEPDRDPQLVAAGQQGLIIELVASHEYREASALFLKSDLRQRLNDNPRVRWLEGRLLAGLGQLTKAENALRNVQEELRESRYALSAATVGLHLLSVLEKQGKYSQLRKTALESYIVFRDLKIRREAAKIERYL